MKSTLPNPNPRRAFTLIELLVSISIIGVLFAISFPAVQYCRESARRTTCENNLRNIGVGLHNFHDTHGSFPAGRFSNRGLNHSWASQLLPYMEQRDTHQRFDFSVPWNHPSNSSAAQTKLPMFLCPTSTSGYPGETDYGGVMGSGMTGMPWGSGRDQAFGCGVLVEVSERYPSRVRFASLLDGASHTIAVAEDVTRGQNTGGMWATGFNCFSHDNGQINQGEAGEINSEHAGGAFVLMADGSVQFVDENADELIVGGMCTGNGGEILQ